MPSTKTILLKSLSLKPWSHDLHLALGNFMCDLNGTIFSPGVSPSTPQTYLNLRVRRLAWSYHYSLGPITTA